MYTHIFLACNRNLHWVIPNPLCTIGYSIFPHVYNLIFNKPLMPGLSTSQSVTSLILQPHLRGSEMLDNFEALWHLNFSKTVNTVTEILRLRLSPWKNLLIYSQMLWFIMWYPKCTQMELKTGSAQTRREQAWDLANALLVTNLGFSLYHHSKTIWIRDNQLSIKGQIQRPRM